MRMLKLTMFVIMLALAVTGCGIPQTAAPTITALPDDESRQIPLPPAPLWREAEVPLTRENISQVQLVGRLEMPEPRSTLFAHALSPDGTRLAGLNNTRLLAWDLVTGTLVLNNARQGAAWLFYAPDKTQLYAIDEAGQVVLYDADTGRRMNDFRGHSAFAQIVAFAEDDGWLALGGEDGTVKVWDPFERVSLVTISAHDSAVRSLAFSADGSLLATADGTGVVRIWRWREREVLATLANNPVSVMRVAFSPDGEHIAVGLVDYIAMWTLTNATLAYALRTGPGGASDVLLFSPDGRYLVNGGTIPDMNVWQVEDGALLALLPEIGGGRTSAVFSPDGSMLLAVVMDGPVTLWDMTSVTESTVVQARLDVGTTRVLAANWTQDSYLLTFVDAHGPVYLWGIPGETQ